ncbi:hypothetical protein I5M32_04925 [Pedobacter sp. SD-b]|uniref:PIN domain-containing protein n=1 Tax=Pedobacter segetis TaxID=2793069 RepID=A0ABS1BHE0_9SPHI|nr:PIN domain-containing protein [Pedobacter segetis]MBK0382297.1 hypothetical protein [Pedobacter segetis]
MKIVVDTNVVFSLLINSQSSIGEIFLDSSNRFEFFSTTYMRVEIVRHWEKLKKISNLSEENLQLALSKILLKLRFINEELISNETWVQAENLVNKIDPFDIDFVALTIHLKADLWTGDKVLYSGLKKLNFKNVLNTNDLKIIKG